MGDDRGATVESIRQYFEQFRSIAEAALARVDDDDFFREPATEMNSLAVLVKHMGGNLRSRWTDFLTTDGEKPDRNRDDEFVIDQADDRPDLMRRWAHGWDRLAATLSEIDDSDLDRTVQVRWEPITVRNALLRQLTHAAYHVGQIVLLARLHTDTWKSLTIPRGESEMMNAHRRAQAGIPEADA